MMKLSTQHKAMDEELLREISQGYLLPLFSGARIGDTSDVSTPSETTVAYLDPQTIGFKVNRSDRYRLKFQRDQPFAKKDDPAREIHVVEAFVSILAEMNDAMNSPLKDDLLSTFQRRVVARSVAERGEERQLLTILDQMSLWATRLYEGTPIASAFGVDPRASGASDIYMDSIAENDFGTVLSNGSGTLLVFDSALRLEKHLALPPSNSHTQTCPLQHASISDWTAEEDGRIAVVLNARGEVLVIRDGHLLFARRNGTWHC